MSLGKPKPACTSTFAFLRANRHDLGALTGQDRRALEAIAHCWELYAASDDVGRAAAIVAVAALLGAMQDKCWRFAREAIAAAMDWDDRDVLWALVDAERRKSIDPAKLSNAELRAIAFSDTQAKDGAR